MFAASSSGRNQHSHMILLCTGSPPDAKEALPVAAGAKRTNPSSATRDLISNHGALYHAFTTP